MSIAGPAVEVGVEVSVVLIKVVVDVTVVSVVDDRVVVTVVTVVVVTVVVVAVVGVVVVVGVVAPLQSANPPSRYALIIALKLPATSKHSSDAVVIAAPTQTSEYAASPGPRNSLTAVSSAAATAAHTEKSMMPRSELATSTALAPSWRSHATWPEKVAVKQTPIISFSMLACASQLVPPSTISPTSNPISPVGTHPSVGS